MGSGGVDGSAAIKAFMVTLISLLFLAEYCGLLRICNKNNLNSITHPDWNQLQDCRVPAYEVGMSVTTEKSTWALYYAIAYSCMTCISFLGCSMILCRSDGFAKFYAICLVLLTAMITVGDYWVIIAIINFAKDNNVNTDSRNFAGFKVAATWFLQLNLYLAAAYDAWDTSDERKVDVRNAR